jgi:hypothetical protein
MELSKPLLVNSGLKVIPALGELMLMLSQINQATDLFRYASCYIGGVLFDYGI